MCRNRRRKFCRLGTGFHAPGPRGGRGNGRAFLSGDRKSGCRLCDRESARAPDRPDDAGACAVRNKRPRLALPCRYNVRGSACAESRRDGSFCFRRTAPHHASGVQRTRDHGPQRVMGASAGKTGRGGRCGPYPRDRGQGASRCICALHDGASGLVPQKIPRALFSREAVGTAPGTGRSRSRKANGPLFQKRAGNPDPVGPRDFVAHRPLLRLRQGGGHGGRGRDGRRGTADARVPESPRTLFCGRSA
ncbi:MAG: hypothetical protein BWY49_00072 [Candidatus Omnitrophica bacterium ADurb.Bin314]|nr:MAG: hypothetical protein BWY49_00072 [Candidatus Omnitrophica bacterium ADurb.Bin314]